MGKTGRKIKVLWLKPKKGNVSIGRYLLSNELRKLGYEIEVKEVSVKTIHKDLLYAVSSNCDIMVGVVRIGAYIGFLASVVNGKPIVIDVTDPIYQINLPGFLRKGLEKIEEIIFKKSSRVIFVTKNYMLEMVGKGVLGVKLNNGVNFEKFSNPQKEIILRAKGILREYGIDLSAMNVLYVGSLKKSYNIRIIIDSAKKLENYNFIFIGDGELKHDVEIASAKLKNVYYLGFFDHEMVPGFVAHADICLCLVNADQPLKLLEYGAASKPVVAIHGELEDRFVNKEVYFIDPTADDLCKALSELAENPKLRRKLGLNLKKRASKLRWSMIAREYDKILRGVLEERDDGGNRGGQQN